MVPDVEALVSSYLRDDAAVLAIVADRIYTAIPNEPTFPLVRLTRIGGAPVTNRPLYHDRALLQFDAYGGPKKLANTIAETVRASLAAAAFVAVHDEGVVVGVEFGPLRWLPDDTETPARPRYSFDVAVHLHE